MHLTFAADESHTIMHILAWSLEPGWKWSLKNPADEWEIRGDHQHFQILINSKAMEARWLEAVAIRQQEFAELEEWIGFFVPLETVILQCNPYDHTHSIQLGPYRLSPEYEWRENSCLFLIESTDQADLEEIGWERWNQRPRCYFGLHNLQPTDRRRLRAEFRSLKPTLPSLFHRFDPAIQARFSLLAKAGLPLLQEALSGRYTWETMPFQPRGWRDALADFLS